MLRLLLSVLLLSAPMCPQELAASGPQTQELNAFYTVHDCDDFAAVVGPNGSIAFTAAPFWAVGALFDQISVAYAIGGGPESESGIPSSTIITEWEGRDGLTHRVETPVPPSGKPEASIERHDQIVKAMLQYYPKKIA